MRISTLALPLAFIAVPVAAQPAPPLPSIPAPADRILSDPTLPDRIGRVTEALTRSVMNLPVGEVEAAIEGRAPTSADRNRRVGDSVRDPNFDRQVADQAAASGRAMQSAGRAIVASLPSIMAALEQAQDSIERTAANLPDPTYPRR